MKREQLEKLELSKEQVDAVMKMYGEDVNALKADHEKALEAAGGDTAEVQKQLDEAMKQIEGFKKLDAEGLQSAVEKLQQEVKEKGEALEQAQKERETAVAAIQFDHRLEAALKAAKVKDPADVMHHIKKDKLVLGDDGNFVGLEEQLKPLQENKSYLFEIDETLPHFVDTTNGTKGTPLSAFEEAAFRGANLENKKE